MKKGIWHNKKYGKQGFVGFYRFDGKSRYLALVGQKSGRRFEVESHEAAKNLGWVKSET